MREALLRHRVLFFRNQLLTPREQVEFGRRFDTLTPAHPVLPGVDGQPEVLAVDSAQHRRRCAKAIAPPARASGTPT